MILGIPSLILSPMPSQSLCSIVFFHQTRCDEGLFLCVLTVHPIRKCYVFVSAVNFVNLNCGTSYSQLLLIRQGVSMVTVSTQ